MVVSKVIPNLNLSDIELFYVQEQCQFCKHWDMAKGCMFDPTESPMRPLGKNTCYCFEGK